MDIMTTEAQIYAKEQQVKLINTILGSLCSIELTRGGRSYLEKLKTRIENELIAIKEMESNQITGNNPTPLYNPHSTHEGSANVA